MARPRNDSSKKTSHAGKNRTEENSRNANSTHSPNNHSHPVAAASALTIASGPALVLNGHFGGELLLLELDELGLGELSDDAARTDSIGIVDASDESLRIESLLQAP